MRPIKIRSWNPVLKQFIFTHQVQALDEQLSCQRIHEEGVGCEVVFDGKDPLSFITRFGMVRVPNGADVIRALRTVWFNGQWNAYWKTGLTEPAAAA